MRRVLWLAVLVAGARGGDSAPTPDTIQRAIDKGVAWLRAAQGDDGSFGPCFPDGTYDGGPAASGYPLGPTAFALYALMVCGVPANDPVVERGYRWYVNKEHEMQDRYSSYESSAAILMLCAMKGVGAPKKLVRSAELRRPPEGSAFSTPEWMRLDERVRHLIGKGGSCYSRGGFGYFDSEGVYADVSATQFAALALRAASFAGYPVERVRPDVWERMGDFLGRLQDRGGGFPYHPPSGASPGMTAAALSTLLICSEQITLLRGAAPPSITSAIDRGLKYMGDHFDVESNPSPHAEGSSHYHYCHLYAIERTGMLSGRHELGGKSWYARGAAYLLDEQTERGSWIDGTCMKPKDILGTCFALLFLKKATIPALTR